MFDTLKYTKKAVDAGFTQQQAEFQAQEFADFYSKQIATKQDIKTLSNKLDAIKNELTIRLGGIVITGIGVLGFILKK